MSDSLLRYVIIPHPARAAALLLPASGAGWTLPSADLPGHFYTAAGSINRAIREQFGIEVTILQMVYRHAAPPTQPAARVYTAENHSAESAMPNGARWVPREELAAMQLAVPEHRTVLTAWFDDCATPTPPPHRAPWACPGWFDLARSWILDQIDQAGLAATGPVEQLKTWSVSCLLTVPTTGGTLYFKASPAMAAAEPGVTLMLSQAFPEQALSLVAVDPERRWMLARAFTGPLLQDDPDTPQWEEALRTYARMQIAMLPKTGALLQAGCHDRTLPVIAAGLDGLLADEALLLGEGRLSVEELERLRAMLPQLRGWIRTVEALGPPATLEHGDLHPGNIAIDGDRLLVFDWSDASVTHPFFSLVNFREALGDATEETRQRLQAAYLEPWAELYPAGDLMTALKLAQPVYELYLALFVQQQILPNVENKAEWVWLAAHHLRKLLSTTYFP